MNNLAGIIEKAESIAVISHINPDGDSIGSILGLGLALKQRCNDVSIFLSDSLPTRYEFLKGTNHLLKYDNMEKNFDLCFVLDCGDIKRLGESSNICNSCQKLINIDHHISNTNFGDINIVDVAASSTCEIIYRILKDMEFTVDRTIASALYTGIVTDTGSFMYDNTTNLTHRIAADLIDRGIDKQNIYYHLYQNRSVNSVRFLGYALNHMELVLNNRMIIFTIPLSILNKFDITHDETEGVVNYGRDIEGVEIAVTIREENENKLKLSFRSKNDHIDVSKLAGYFGGGGHKKASGATLHTNLADGKKQVIEAVKQFIRW